MKKNPWDDYLEETQEIYNQLGLLSLRSLFIRYKLKVSWECAEYLNEYMIQKNQPRGYH